MQYILFPTFLVYHTTILLNTPSYAYVKGKLKYVLSYMEAPGRAVIRGGVLQTAFNRLQKTIGNIPLGGLGAYEETLGMAHVC